MSRASKASTSDTFTPKHLSRTTPTQLGSLVAAASSVGQSYTGGLLCTRDGTVPPADVLNGQIKEAFESVDIKLFELFVCDNSVTEEDVKDPPPLDFYRKGKDSSAVASVA